MARALLPLLLAVALAGSGCAERPVAADRAGTAPGTALSAGAALRATSQPQRLASIPLSITTADGKTHRYRVELARTAEQQSVGMMFRRSVPAGTGMLFPHVLPRAASFWMKNTLVPLDIIFIAPGRRVESFATGVPLSLDPVESMGPVAGVLELAGGEARRIGLQPGDLVGYEVPEGD